MHQAIASSTLMVLKGVRHLTPLEMSDTIAGKLRSLLQQANKAAEAGGLRT
jgi:hypothetical protein